jgi:hypothetical protein
MTKHPVLALFLAVQFVGISCLALWERVPSAMGVPMWGTALILLFPGNFLGGWLVPSVFWQHGLSLTTIGLLSLVAALAINAIIWLAATKAVGLASRRLRSSSDPVH